jgi:opacity protein-like surface antigen
MEIRVGKLLLTFFLISMSSISAVAQFSIGLQGGANLSQMDFTNNQDYKFTEISYAQGFIGGLVVQFIGEKHAGVQFELNYTQRGWVEADTVGENNLKIKNKMDYIEMPILTHVNIGGGNFRGLFNLGPYLGYALNRSITTTDENTGQAETDEYTFNKDLDNRLDFGLLVGAGFEYRFKKSKLSAEARYTIGLGDINKDKVAQSELSQFRILAVLVRYTIPIGKGLDPE